MGAVAGGAQAAGGVIVTATPHYPQDDEDDSDSDSSKTDSDVCKLCFGVLALHSMFWI